MALLIIFGFIAGAATALSPCVLPVLPIALSAGATGGRRRPLGIVAGLAVSFTFATVALVYVISALGLPNDFLRKLAIVVLLGFGVVLMIPPLAARLEAWMSQFASRAGVAKGEGDGFWSGTAVGASLGLVYAPCAGPILAGVITVSASQSFSTGRLAVALSYGIGSAVVLYFLMLGGRKVVRPLAQRGVGLQIAMGAVMVVVALAMLGNYDIRFQNHIASSLPGFLVDPSKSIEETASAKAALADVRGDGGHGVGSEASGAAPETGADGKLKKLPVLGVAPEFVGTEQWFNTPGDKPLTLSALRGRVVLVDFWTYSCINCIRTLPYLKAWDAKYRKDGLTIVGVHTPELLAEAGRPVKGGDTRVHAIAPSATVTTPETYLGAARAERFTNSMLSPGSHDFTAPKALPANEFAYHGKWRITLESATAGAGASLDLNFGARRVYLVLGSPGRDRNLRVLLDGRPISSADAGSDVHDGAVTVTGQRLYNLVNLPKVGQHVLTLEPEAGVQGYAFTFG